MDRLQDRKLKHTHRRIRESGETEMSQSLLEVMYDNGRGWAEGGFRIVLIIGFLLTEVAKPFQRVIQTEEMWLYRNPKATVPSLEEFGGFYFHMLLTPFMMVVWPLFAISCVWTRTSNLVEAREAVYAYSMCVPLTGFIINTIKIYVGRPRPDYLARCYQSYYSTYYDMSRDCTGDLNEVKDGRKSFPSGHTGLAACTFGFLALYLAAQIGTFHERSKYRITAVLAILPMYMAAVIVGISRTCDYKHHWQDVVVGGAIGFLVSFICYRIYFPSIFHEQSDLSYVSLRKQESRPHLTQSGASIQQVYRGALPATTTSEDERDEVVETVRYRIISPARD